MWLRIKKFLGRFRKKKKTYRELILEQKPVAYYFFDVEDK